MTKIGITRKNGITNSDKDSMTFDIRVHDIKWPKGKSLPKDTFLIDVEVPEDDEDKSLGDVIFDRLSNWFNEDPISFYWENADVEDDEDEDEDTSPDFLDDLIDAVSKKTVEGRVFSVMSVLADHGLLPSEEDDTDSEDEDCDCECDDDCDCDCDECPCEDEESEEDEEVSEDEYFNMCADFLNGLVNLVKESKKGTSKDTDK